MNAISETGIAALTAIGRALHRGGEIVLGVLLTAGIAAAQGEVSESAVDRAAFARVPTPVFAVTAFDVVGDNPIGPDAAAVVLKDFLGAHTGVEGLQAAADELEAKINRAGFQFHRVTLPPQRLVGGVVTLKVLAFTLGKVTVVGNRFFTTENILASVPALVPGAVTVTDTVAHQVEFANESPAKQVVLGFKDSEVTDAIDATLTVQDIDPIQYFFSLANTGSQPTGFLRSTFGFLNADLFGLDGQLSATYTTSPGHFRDVRQWGVSYRKPLYDSGAIVQGSFVNSDVDSGVVNGIEIAGRGTFFGFRLEQPLAKIDDYRHRLAVAIDQKNFGQSVTLNGVSLGVPVSSRPLTMDYSMRYQRPRATVSGNVQLVQNIVAGKANDAAQYTASRVGAIPQFRLMRLNLGADLSLEGGASLKLGFSGQKTGDVLIAGEQFGAGGSTRPRGFNEREFSGDYGYKAWVEYWSAPFGDSGVQLVYFYDWARVSLNEATLSQNQQELISSVGVGLRTPIGGQGSLSLDYGHVLTAGASGQGTQVGDKTLHGAFLYRF